VTKQISVEQQESDLERRISEIQVQLERLNAAVAQPAEDRQPLALVETRVWSLTQQFAEILDRWTLSDLRHTRAIGEMEARLKDLEGLKARVEHNAEDHLRNLERKVAGEWSALQHMLEQPIKQLQEHAASLRETSVATAGTALSGLERAETRLATIQADLSDRMTQLSREVQATLAEIRGGLPRAAQASASTTNWPLDQVMRLHDELRGTDGEERRTSHARDPQAIALLPESVESSTRRIDPVDRAVPTDKETVEEIPDRAKHGRTLVWIAAVVVLIVGLIVSAAFALRLQREFEAASAKITEAERETQSTRAIAKQQVAASQQEAERRIVEANDTALRAQMVSEVLAAPDLVRYGLSGGDGAPTARGQLLWSRSRGIVLSASRVPTAPSGMTYQLWLLTSSGATHAGSTDADAEGRLSLATDKVPTVPRPVVGAALTMEPTSVGPRPSGPTVLSYRPSRTPEEPGGSISDPR
jgi:hypothetical protein